ncbi:MAG: glycosyltransferase [Thermoplasmata archaeon]
METLKFLMVSTHFPPHHLGGDAVLVEYLANDLVKRGHEVHVFYNPGAYELLRREKRVVGLMHEGPLIRHPYASRTKRIDPIVALSTGWWRKAQDKLMEIAQETKPDIIHWHNPRGFIGKPFAIKGTTSLHTSHDYSAICPRSNLLRPGMVLCDEARFCTVCCMRWRKPPQLWRAGGRRVLRFPDSLTVLSPTEFAAKRLRQEGVKVHKILRNFVPDYGKDFQRKDSKDDSIIYLGMMEKHKGVVTLLDAFAMSKETQGFRLYMIGEGSLKESLRKRVSRERLNQRVEIPGFLSRDKLENLRRNAVAQVIPSVWYENAPLVALEGLSLGIPILASEIGGLPEIMGEESGGDTFRPGDSDQLADLLTSTWRTRHELEERRRMARKRYEGSFTPDIHYAEYMRIIDEAQG